MQTNFNGDSLPLALGQGSFGLLAFTALQLCKSIQKIEAERLSRSRRKRKIALMMLSADSCIVKGRLGNTIRDRSIGLEFIRNVNDKMFRRMFRLSRDVFYLLLNKVHMSFFARIIPNNTNQVQSVLIKSEMHGRNSSGSCIQAEIRLAITLRWLSGGSYLDIGALFGIDASTLTVHIWPCLTAIDRILDLNFPIENAEQLAALENVSQQYHMDECEAVWRQARYSS